LAPDLLGVFGVAQSCPVRRNENGPSIFILTFFKNREYIYRGWCTLAAVSIETGDNNYARKSQQQGRA
jgi:hypothetical protein